MRHFDHRMIVTRLSMLVALALGSSELVSAEDSELELSLYESAFRRVIAHVDRDDGVYLLSMVDADGRKIDPPAEFLARFGDLRVAPGSNREFTDKRSVRDKHSKSPAVIVEIRLIRSSSADEGRVMWSYYIGYLASGGGTWLFIRSDYGWTFKESIGMEWVS